MNESQNQPENETTSPDESTTSSDGKSGIRKVPPAPWAIVPRNMKEVKELLTGRNENFREPLTQREEREYQKVWKQGGRGLTKKMYKDKNTRRRKARQKKLNKWARARRDKKKDD